MTYKEKMGKLENWLEIQYGESYKRCKKEDENGNGNAALVAAISGMVFLQVLNKLSEIEKAD